MSGKLERRSSGDDVIRERPTKQVISSLEIDTASTALASTYTLQLKALLILNFSC
jgi:hypothetical protein